MILVSNYQSIVKLGVFFNIPWMKEIWHDFTKWRPHECSQLRRCEVMRYQINFQLGIDSWIETVSRTWSKVFLIFGLDAMVFGPLEGTYEPKPELQALLFISHLFFLWPQKWNGKWCMKLPCCLYPICYSSWCTSEMEKGKWNCLVGILGIEGSDNYHYCASRMNLGKWLT